MTLWAVKLNGPCLNSFFPVCFPGCRRCVPGDRLAQRRYRHGQLVRKGQVSSVPLYSFKLHAGSSTKIAFITFWKLNWEPTLESKISSFVRINRRTIGCSQCQGCTPQCLVQGEGHLLCLCVLLPLPLLFSKTQTLTLSVNGPLCMNISWQLVFSLCFVDEVWSWGFGTHTHP